MSKFGVWIWIVELKVFPFSLFIYLFFNFPHSLFFLFFFLSLLSFVLLLLCHLIVPCVTLSYYLVALSCYLDLLPYCATSSHRPIVLPPRVASLLHCVASLLHCVTSLLHHIASLPSHVTFLLLYHRCFTSLPSFVASFTTITHYLTSLLRSLPLFVALLTQLFNTSFVVITVLVHCSCNMFVYNVIYYFVC